MTREQKLSTRARFAMLRHDMAKEGNEAVMAALDAAIGCLDRDLDGRMRMYIEASQGTHDAA